jgi:recombination protein RecR
VKSVVPIQKVIDGFESLPGVGPKTAARLAYYLLHVPQERLQRFADSLSRLRIDTKICKQCFNVGEADRCTICEDTSRDKTVLCVVEEVLDLVAIEKAESFRGLYHVLGGAIRPLNNIGPEELTISNLLERLKTGVVREIILATNTSLEGEATAMYIREKMSQLGLLEGVKVTRLGRGLATGAEVEFADGTTLARALEGRVEM